MQPIYVNLERDHLLFKLSANDVVVCSLLIPRFLKKSGKYTKSGWLDACNDELTGVFASRMDDLRRAIFMARNSGNSVRIVLPFNKMAKVNKTAAFRFAEYIRIKVAQVNDAEDTSDEVCVCVIHAQWSSLFIFL